MHLTDAQLTPIQALYDRGLFVQAWRAVLDAGLPPLGQWRGPSGRLLAGRLAGRLGARRLADAVFLRGRREAPDDARAAIYDLYSTLHRRGPWAAWLRLRVLAQHGPRPDPAADPHTAADFACVRAVLLATFRDFASAHAALTEADASTPAREWVEVQRAHVLEQEDRCAEALAACTRALATQRFFVPGVTSAAHLLQVLGRDHEAVDLLQTADVAVESYEVAAALSLLHEELGDDSAALAAVERVQALTPLAERPIQQWLAARRCDLSLRLGQREAARTHAAAVGNPFYSALGDRLAQADADTERVVLPVPFVRQDHMTCGPATLVALAQWFGREPDHLQVADEICYGGTSAANARRWALRNGFAAREFTLDADAAHALLRRRMPFAVATAEATSGHLQAVIGFDALRGTLLVRDPSTRGTREWATREFLQHYRACGPRSLLLFPPDCGHEGLPPLPDAELHDDDFAIQEALAAHDHARALGLYHAMLEREPDHPLTIQARWALSAYECDPVGALACIERLLALFANDQRLLLRKVWALIELDQSAEVVATLEQLAAQRGSDPVFAVMLAEEMRRRPGGPARARDLLHRALLRQPAYARAHYALAVLGWQSDDDPAAGEGLRFAACLDETNDDCALTYFEWCRAHGDAATGLDFLRARQARWLRRAGGPSVALYRALLRQHRDDEANAVLASARDARPDDGDLLLADAEEALRTGDLARAEARLRAAEGKAFESRRVAALADVAERAGDRAQALRCWHSILAREPLNHRARVAAFDLVQTLHGRQAALSDLEAAASELPFARPLCRFYAHQLGRDDAVAAARVLASIVEDDPGDAWAQRELALQLAAQGRLEEALAASDAACGIDAESASGHAIAGRLLTRLGRTEEARARLRLALARDVDELAAIVDLWDITIGTSARRTLCDELVAAFSADAGSGRGLEHFAQLAAQSQPATEVRAWLEAIARAQPHARAASSALIAHLLRIDDVEAADAAAARGCAMFPLDARAWLDRGAVARRRQGDDEVAALERAAMLAPGSPEVAWYLATAYRRHGRRDEARRVLEEASAAARDPSVLTALAELHAEDGDHEAALARARQALQLDVDHGGAWEVLQGLAERAEDAHLLVREARTLAAGRPHDPAVHLMLASMLRLPEQRDERRQAIERALALDPSSPDAHDGRMEMLGEEGAFEAARQGLAAYEGPLPTNLRGRLAWLTHAEGHTDDAIAAMRALLDEQPYYTWGWRHLLEWLDAADRQDEVAAAAAAYAASRPGDPVALGWLGEAHLRANARADAKQAFMRALRLNPDYAFAAIRLFVMHLDDGELDEADANLELLARIEHSARVEVFRVQSACRRRDPARAGVHARRLCLQHAEDTPALWAAADALAGAGLADAARQEVADLLPTAAGSGAAVLTLRTLTATEAWAKAFACVNDAELPERVFVAAASTLLTDLAESPRARRVHELLRTSARQRLHAHVETWGKTGYCLNMAGAMRGTVKWMADWQQRGDRQAWMLVNLAHALRHLGRLPQARAVSSDAVELPGDDGAAGYHHAWLALHAYADDDLESARAHVARAAVDAGDPTRAVLDLARDLVDAAAAPRAHARRQAVRALDAARRHAASHRDVALQRALRTVIPVTRRRLGVPSVWWLLLG